MHNGLVSADSEKDMITIFIAIPMTDILLHLVNQRRMHGQITFHNFFVLTYPKLISQHFVSHTYSYAYSSPVCSCLLG